VSRQTITYCPVCDDGWSDENYMLGVCCGGAELEERPETDEEFCSRVAAENRVRQRAEELDW